MDLTLQTCYIYVENFRSGYHKMESSANDEVLNIQHLNSSGCHLIIIIIIIYFSLIHWSQTDISLTSIYITIKLSAGDFALNFVINIIKLFIKIDCGNPLCCTCFRGWILVDLDCLLLYLIFKNLPIYPVPDDLKTDNPTFATFFSDNPIFTNA